MNKKHTGKIPPAHHQIHYHHKPKLFGRVFFYTVLIALVGYALLLSTLVKK